MSYTENAGVFIPDWLLRVPVRLLTDRDKIIYGRLYQLSRLSGKMFISINYSQLAKETGKSFRTIERSLSKLRKVGLIKTHKGENKTNYCEFLRHEWMELIVYEPTPE